MEKYAYGKFQVLTERIASMMEGSNSETSINFYQTTRHNIPEELFSNTYTFLTVESFQHYCQDQLMGGG
jgi:guanylate kinase